MDQTEIIEKLKTIITTYITQPELVEEVNDDSHLLRDLKINSAHLIDIVLDIEAAFDIAISDEEVEKMDTVGNAVKLVSEKVSEK